LTDNTEEAEKAIDMLRMFIETLKEGFIKYIKKTSEICLKLIDYKSN